MTELITPEIVALTDEMQRQCAHAYVTVASGLRAGMSETEIARALRNELRAAGVTDFWYDIPIVVLVGIPRFMQMILADYGVKSPSEQVALQANTPFFVDIHPRHASGRWGNFAASGIYRPAGGEQVAFLEQMQRIHREGIRQLTPRQTGAEVARWFGQLFQQYGIEHLDVRANFGHSMGAGLKSDYQRLFLDEHNDAPIGGYIYGIEPGGVRRSSAGQVIAVARFEDCVYIPPGAGQPVLLGRQEPAPVVFI